MAMVSGFKYFRLNVNMQAWGKVRHSKKGLTLFRDRNVSMIFAQSRLKMSTSCQQYFMSLTCILKEFCSFSLYHDIKMSPPSRDILSGL